MTTINLLPWREKRREEKKRQFFGLIAASGLAMLLLLVVIHITLMSKVSFQKNNNAYLQTQVEEIDEQLKKISGLQKEKSQLLARMDIIHELQTKRPQVVHLFDELPRIIPNGIYLTNITRQENMIDLTGKAESNTLVSGLMRNIDASLWLTKPELQEIKTDAQFAPFINSFTLQLELKKNLEI